MSPHIGKRWVLLKHFEGQPKLSDFKLVEEDLGDIKDGEIIYETEFIGVDPWQRVWANILEVKAEHYNSK